MLFIIIVFIEFRKDKEKNLRVTFEDAVGYVLNTVLSGW